jgi:3',5'-cyclic AMP phosphodiesterase CpdA
MYFVTKDFLDALESEVAGPAAGHNTDSLITNLWTDPKSPAFDIEIISDLAVDAPVGSSSMQDQSQEITTALVDRVRRLRQAFKSNRSADLLVCCGDLVAARRDTSLPELRRVESTFSDICVPAFRQLQEADKADHRSRNRRDLFPKLLTIPGNEDVYCGGGSGQSPWILPHAARSDEPDTLPYYSIVAKQLASNELPDKAPESHPVAAIFRILTEKARNTADGLDQVPWAYVVLIGFDSNDVQYKHPLARNYGQIDDEQLQW